MREPDPILDRWHVLASSKPQWPLVVGPDRRATVEDVEILSRHVASAVESRRLAGGLVGLCAANGVGFLAAFLGLRRAACGVALLDHRAPRGAILRGAQKLGCAEILEVPEWPGGEAWQEWTSAQPPHAAASLGGGAPILKVTSGSTGEPQAVVTPAEALVADDEALARTMGLVAEDRILAAIPMSHSYGLSSVAMPALVRGTTLVVPDSRHPWGAVLAAKQQQVTVMPTVPAYLDRLTRASRPPRTPPSLRLVLAAGAPLEAATASSFRRLYGLPVHVFYGASECGGIAYDRDGSAAERGTLGTPVEGVRIDLDKKRGDRGLVCVRSPAVARSYYPRPHSRLGEGVYKSSDIGSWLEGELRLHGREDDIINVRGKKVDPMEVEEVLRQLTGVREVAVVGIPESGGSFVIRAVVATDAGLDIQAVRDWCQHRLAEHKVPRSVLFVRELPRNARGKLDRTLLRAVTPDAAGLAGDGEPTVRT